MAIWTLGRTASGWPYISSYILTFLYGCILLAIGSIYTKLGDFVKLGLHFMTIVINSTVDPMFYRLVPSPTRFENRQ